MTSLFSGLDRAENNPFIYGAFEFSPENPTESWLGNWTSPDVEGAIPNQEATSMNNSRNNSRNNSSTDLTDIAALHSELSRMAGELQATKSRLRDLVYGFDARMSCFEQKYQHDQIKTSRIRHAQDTQLERRLYQFIQKTVVESIQRSIDKVIRVRRSVRLEPPTQASTYTVPNRPEGKGIFR